MVVQCQCNKGDFQLDLNVCHFLRCPWFAGWVLMLILGCLQGKSLHIIRGQAGEPEGSKQSEVDSSNALQSVRYFLYCVQAEQKTQSTHSSHPVVLQSRALNNTINGAGWEQALFRAVIYIKRNYWKPVKKQVTRCIFTSLQRVWYCDLWFHSCSRLIIFIAQEWEWDVRGQCWW